MRGALRTAELLARSLWRPGQAERFQGERLRQLVRHAYQRVPFYRQRLQDHGVDPAQSHGVEGFARLPLTRRSDLQAQPVASLLAAGTDQGRLVRWRSSGSTGEPFTTYRTWREDRLLHAFRLRQLRGLGLRWTDLCTGPFLGEPPRLRSLSLLDTRFSILRRAAINILASPREILDRLGELQPDVIGLYAGTLDWIAAEATTEDRRRIRPRFMATGADMLTPEMRERITGCFGAPVYDCYGAHEFNLIAGECPRTGLYHVEDGSVLVEVLRDGRPCAEGQTGELFGTALHSFAMPYLRYSVGDLVTRGPARCPCGSGASTLLRVEGRVIDRFARPDGGFLHPLQLGPAVRRSPWVRRFEIVQETLERLRVRIVPLPGQAPAEEKVAAIHSQLAELAGADLVIEVEITDQLPPSPGGKFRQFRSLVTHPSSSTPAA